MDRPLEGEAFDQASQAYKDIIATDAPHPFRKATSHLRSTAQRARCYRCREHGHVVRDCTKARNNKPYARPVRAIRRSKNSVVGYQI
jgi:hypothetical protein